MLDALARGTSACVALEGEPGIGKTRLLAELRRRAEDARLTGPRRGRRRSSSATCRSASGSTPSTPTSLRRSSAWTTAGTPSWSTSSPACCRRSAVRPGRAAPSPTSATAPTGAVRRLLELLARSRPLVLVLDDLHWSDAASIELLAALLRRGADAPVLLALGVSPRAGARAPVGRARGAVGPERSCSSRSARAQAGELLGELDPRSAAAIYRHGGGNPFYLEQLARAHGEAQPDRDGRRRVGGRRARRRRRVARG